MNHTPKALAFGVFQFVNDPWNRCSIGRKGCVRGNHLPFPCAFNKNHLSILTSGHTPKALAFGVFFVILIDLNQQVGKTQDFPSLSF